MTAMNGSASVLELPAAPAGHPATPAAGSAAPSLAALAAGTPMQLRGGFAGEVRSAFCVMAAMLRMSLIEARRYYFNTIVRLITIYAFFFTLFMGAKAAMGASGTFGASLSSLVVGMLVFMMAQRAYQDHSGRLAGEAAQGTLEQLAMSPIGLSRVLVYNMAAMMVAQLGFNAVFLGLMMATTNRWLHLDVLSIVPLLVLSILAVHGMGLAMGGLALIFKRVGATSAIFQYVFLMLVAVPVDKAPFFKYLPLAWGAKLIRQVMVDGASLYSMPAGDVLFLVANSAAYFTAGLLVFKACERAARNRGMLGHY